MTTLTKQTSELSELIASGIECWVKAGKILVEMLDSGETNLADVSEKTGLTPGVLSRFEQLGRNQLVPELLIANYPASKYIQKLPYSEQKRLIDDSIEVLASDQGDKLNVMPKNLTTSQCKQVFTSNSVRDLGGQRAWVESRKQKKSESVTITEMPYHISGSKVFFDQGCTMKASQLISILAQLTPKK